MKSKSDKGTVIRLKEEGVLYRKETTKKGTNTSQSEKSTDETERVIAVVKKLRTGKGKIKKSRIQVERTQKRFLIKGTVLYLESIGGKCYNREEFPEGPCPAA